MARARKIDETQALQAAMHLFWRDGFHPVGTRAIEKETGITRFTLQTSYGGKRSLFLKCLDSYLDLFSEVRLPQLAQGGLGILERWFICQDLPPDLAEARLNGCLMVNSIMAFPLDDSEVMARADRFYSLLREAFAKALHNARAQGELRDGIDIDTSVELLLGVALASNVVMKSSGPGADPDGLARAIGATINSWKANGPAKTGPSV